jgi:hypothetical protein
MGSKMLMVLNRRTRWFWRTTFKIVQRGSAKSIFRGCTTIHHFRGKLSGLTRILERGWVRCGETGWVKELVWLTYKEVVNVEQDVYAHLRFQRRFGWMSDSWIASSLRPRKWSAMLGIQRPQPNVMVKVTGSMQVIAKILTSRGISTNTTICYFAPILASANAAMDGIKMAEKTKLTWANGAQSSR